MRRLKRITFLGGLAIIASLAFSSVASATHGGQTASLSFTGKGKAEKKGTPGQLRVQLANTDDPSTSSPIPPLLNQYVAELSSGISIDTGAFPVCNTSLEGLTAEQAQQACGSQAPKSQNALVGTAAATVQIGPNVVNATGLAFNGPGELTVFIRADALNVTTIIHCALGNSPARLPVYGRQFTCPIPPLAGGAGAVTSVDFTFERTEVVKKKKKKSADAAASKKKKKKKTKAFIRGKCPSSGVYNYRSTFTYNDHETEVITNEQPC